jgi:hypothetical protein
MMLQCKLQLQLILMCLQHALTPPLVAFIDFESHSIHSTFRSTGFLRLTGLYCHPQLILRLADNQPIVDGYGAKI